MTPNDKQIDLLMRRYAPSANRAIGGEHLDADEISAFAEGNLPPAARMRYVSHLADCDHCRQMVSQVTLSGAAATRVEPLPEKSHSTFWQTLTGLFALPVLRYAAFAAVLVIVAGVAYVALRRPRPTEMVAVNEPANQQPVSASKSAGTFANQNTENTQSTELASATPGAQPSKVGEETKPAETTIAPTTSTLKDATAPVEEKKAAEPVLASKAPAYSPPPPADQVAAREQQGLSTVATRKAEQTDKLDRDVAKESGRSDDTRGYVMNQPASPQQRARDEKGKGGPSRNFENFKQQNQQNQTQTETRSSDAPKTAGADERRQQEQEAPATRSVGGRTFRRQGPSWVDVKFKTSMSVKSVSRGSDQFKALDSGLRSIAQQLGGEVLVVWKGQAYLIR